MNEQKSKIVLVVAAAENNAIGKNNQLLWKLPDDLRFFKNITWAMPVIMGRKTFESFGKALPGRTNIVITRQKDWRAEGAIPVNSWKEALEQAALADTKEIMVAGGAEIYNMALPFADIIYLTRVEASFEADAYFPAIDPAQFNLASSSAHPVDAKHAVAFRFEKWERISS